MKGVHFSWLLGRAVVRFVAPLVVALGVTMLPLVAYAGTITVNGTSCKLPDAITAANTDAATNGCTKGSGVDTLLLTAPIYSLATGPYDYDGLTATPSVTTTIIISGGVDGAIVERSGSAQYRLFHVAAAGNLTLQNVVVRYGNITGDGGAVYNRGALTLLDSQLFSNTAVKGGGLFNDHSTATLTNSHIIANTATNFSGGGLMNVGGSVTLAHTDFISNTATDGNGGGLLSGSDAVERVTASVTLTNCRFISNIAESGGGIYSANSTITLVNSDLMSNMSIGVGVGVGGGGGGGIYNYGEYVNSAIYTAKLSLTNSHLVGNSALSRGGGLVNDGGTVSITNSEFNVNTVINIPFLTEGGGIYNNRYLTLANSDFISNSAFNGGGIYNKMDLSLANSDFMSNTASNGGGIYNNGQLNTANSDFISNTAEMGGGLYNSFSLATLANSDFISNIGTYGGGIYSNGGTTTLSDSDLVANTANFGGGIYTVSDTSASAITITNSEIRANIAISSGGGLNQSGQATIVSSRFMENAAGDTGSAMQQVNGTTTIDQSCIVNNTDTAVNYAGGDPIAAANNWWGAPDGPSGVGPGAGDTVSGSVTFTPFLTLTPAACSKVFIYLPHLKR